MGWHTRIVQCIAPSEKRMGSKEWKIIRELLNSWTTRKDSIDQGSPDVWIQRWAHSLTLQMSDLKEIPVLKYKEYKSYGKEIKKRHWARKHQAWVTLKESVTVFIPCVFLGLLGKTRRVGVFRRLVTLAATTEPKDHIQYVLQHMDTGTNGTEVGQSLSDTFGLSSDEPSRHVSDSEKYSVTLTTKTHWTLGCLYYSNSRWKSNGKSETELASRQVYLMQTAFRRHQFHTADFRTHYFRSRGVLPGNAHFCTQAGGFRVLFQRFVAAWTGMGYSKTWKLWKWCTEFSLFTFLLQAAKKHLNRTHRTRHSFTSTYKTTGVIANIFHAV